MTARDLPARARTVALAAALLLSVPVLAACGGAATDEIYNPAQGTNARDGQVDVLNAMVVSDGKDGGRLIAGLTNENQFDNDSLTGVTSSASGVTVEVGSGDKEIPADGLLQLADDGSAEILVKGVTIGRYVDVTFEFAKAEPVTINVPIVEAGEDFDRVQVPDQVTPSVTGAVEPTPTDSPSTGE